jgi:integrase
LLFDITWVEGIVAYAEKRGNLWRARWVGPDGTLESKSGFRKRKDAEDYGRDQEAAIRNNTYIGPRAGKITLTEWVNRWFPAQDLELNTLSTYRYTIEVLILPEFGGWSLSALEMDPEKIALWEKQLLARGYTRRTAREARSTLTTILADAIPRYIRSNPAARKRGKGRKGQRRIERAEQAEKTWASPLEALLFAERCAVLSGDDSDFVMQITLAYTGMRWSEAQGLPPEAIHDHTLDIAWKLYELNARFYRGRPKDGSIRTVDLPPFLSQLLTWFLDSNPVRTCTCRNTEPPWCPGMEYVFLGQQNAHYRRSNYATRIVRPAADGWYPERKERKGSYTRPAMPVLVDTTAPWPGVVLAPWPPANPGEPYTPPSGRGIPRLGGKEGSGRCLACNRTIQLRKDGTLIKHKLGAKYCEGSGTRPGEPPSLANWLPLRPGLTAHGLRHGHQTWLDDLGIRYVLQSERMGHEVPGMRGVYSHITSGMRAELREGLQQLWETSLIQRVQLAKRSSVGTLDELLSAC